MFLPTQQQWSLAAQKSFEYLNNEYSNTLISLSNNKEFKLMLGGVWELTSSQFIPLDRLTNNEIVHNNLKELNINNDIIVKGGSILK